MCDYASEMRALRERTGLDQHDFAEKFGITETKVRLCEAGLFKPKLLAIVVIERIIDLVDLYGEPEFHWANNCRSILASL